MDPAHVFHQTATTWFKSHRAEGWATCPTTESGFIRILSNPKYPNITLSPAQAADLLVRLVKANSSTHHWWPETISLRDTQIFDLTALTGYKQITDTWLIAIAATNQGALATCDLRLGPSGVQVATATNITSIRSN
jgi:toxin-antitoxin system PIN domain toxin